MHFTKYDILLQINFTKPGYSNMGITFFGGNMDHWCQIPRLANFSFEQQKNIAIPFEEPSKSDFNQCYMYDMNYSAYSDEELVNWNRTLMESVSNVTIECRNGWVFDKSVFVSSIVSQDKCHRRH